jgi:hypothetical protein
MPQSIATQRNQWLRFAKSLSSAVQLARQRPAHLYVAPTSSTASTARFGSTCPDGQFSK